MDAKCGLRCATYKFVVVPYRNADIFRKKGSTNFWIGTGNGRYMPQPAECASEIGNSGFEPICSRVRERGRARQTHRLDWNKVGKMVSLFVRDYIHKNYI